LNKGDIIKVIKDIPKLNLIECSIKGIDSKLSIFIPRDAVEEYD
jgi:hypothetical protein